MQFTYRTATDKEKDTLKCNRSLDNHMQCARTISKIITVDNKSSLDTEYQMNLPTNNGTLAYCPAHFNILLASIQLEKGNSVLNLDENGETKQ